MPAQRLDTRLMASATVGVCLGCVCGVSLMIAASKWLHGRVGDPDAWIRTLYYLAFFGSLAWSVARGNTDLVAALNAGLNIMLYSGRYDAMSVPYFKDDPVPNGYEERPVYGVFPAGLPGAAN